jgi:hypothetical protein
MSKVRSDYAVLKLKDNVIYIKDLDFGGVSDDAENVLRYLQESFGADKRVIYQDSMGRWDEMKFDDRGEVQFSPVDQDAVWKVVESYG